MQKQIINQMGIDSQLIRDRLSKMDIGETISYKELSTIIQKDITGHRHIFYTAAKSLMPDGFVFDCVAGVGFRRLNDTEKVDVAANGFTRIRKIANKCIRQAQAVTDFDTLPNDKKLKHNMVLSIGGAVRLFTGSSGQKRVESAVTPVKELDLSGTLKLFSM